MSDYGQDVVDRGLEQLKGTWEYNDEEYDLLVEDISYPDFQLAREYATIAAQLGAAENGEDIDAEQLQERVEALDSFSFEDDDEGEADFIPLMVDEKLVRPEVDVSATPTAKLRAIIEGMMRTWREADDVADAREEMPLEGNA